jgi:hypothetical protein
VFNKNELVTPLIDVRLSSLSFTLPAIDPEKIVIDPDISDAICAEPESSVLPSNVSSLPSWSDPVEVFRAMSIARELDTPADEAESSLSVAKVASKDEEKSSWFLTRKANELEVEVNEPDISPAICSELDSTFIPYIVPSTVRSSVIFKEPVISEEESALYPFLILNSFAICVSSFHFPKGVP